MLKSEKDEERVPLVGVLGEIGRGYGKQSKPGLSGRNSFHGSLFFPVLSATRVHEAGRRSRCNFT